MPLSFDYSPIIDELRSRMVTAFSIPAGHPVLYTGGEIIKPTNDNLPLGIIQSDGEFEVSQGEAVNDVKTKPRFQCWFIDRTIKGVDNNLSIRQGLAKLGVALYNDRKLLDAGNNPTCNYLNVLAMNDTGRGSDWPVDIETGIGLIAAYLTVEIWVIESIL